MNRLKKIKNPINIILRSLLIRLSQNTPLSFSRLISNSLRLRYNSWSCFLCQLIESSNFVLYTFFPICSIKLPDLENVERNFTICASIRALLFSDILWSISMISKLILFWKATSSFELYFTIWFYERLFLFSLSIW